MLVLFVSVYKKIGFPTGTVFAFVFFEVNKMNSRKFDIVYICLCSHESSV